MTRRSLGVNSDVAPTLRSRTSGWTATVVAPTRGISPSAFRLTSVETSGTCVKRANSHSASERPARWQSDAGTSSSFLRSKDDGFVWHCWIEPTSRRRRQSSTPDHQYRAGPSVPTVPCTSYVTSEVWSTT